MAARTHTLRRAAAGGGQNARDRRPQFSGGCGGGSGSGPRGCSLGWLVGGGGVVLSEAFSMVIMVFTLAKCVLVYLLALSVLGPESPAAAATAMTCDESSKRGAHCTAGERGGGLYFGSRFLPKVP